MLHKIYHNPDRKSRNSELGISNTQPECQNKNQPLLNVHLDYLRCKRQYLTDESLIEDLNFILDFSFDGELAVLEEGNYYVSTFSTHYKFAYTGIIGCRILFNFADENNFGESPNTDIDFSFINGVQKSRNNKSKVFTELGKESKKIIPELLIEMSGKYFIDLDLMTQFNLISVLNSKGFDCTRIDIAADDTAYHFSTDFLQSVQDNKNFCYVRARDRRVSYGKDADGNDAIFTTFYFGSRTSSAYYRIYDCYPVHGFSAQRFEGEFSGEKSKFIFRILAETPTNIDIAKWYADNIGTGQSFSRICDTLSSDDYTVYLSSELSRYLVSFIDFVDRSKNDKHLSRLDRLFEFQMYLQRLFNPSPTRIKIEKPQDDFATRNENWVLKQVSKSLYLRYLSLGEKGFLGWLTNLFSIRKYRLLEDFSRNRDGSLPKENLELSNLNTDLLASLSSKDVHIFQHFSSSVTRYCEPYVGSILSKGNKTIRKLKLYDIPGNWLPLDEAVKYIEVERIDPRRYKPLN